MGALRCPRCGQSRVRRCPRVGLLERALSAVDVFPFRCQLCGRRFRALHWGARWAKRPVDRREFERVAVRAPLAVVSHRGSVEGEVTELSLQGCTARTRAPMVAGATVELELRLLPEERPVVVEAALVRSVRADTAGFYFVRVRPEEQRRIRRALAGLFPTQHEGTAPAPPLPDGRLGVRRSADFWLAALLLVLAVLAALAVTGLPRFSQCVWGLTC